MSSVLQQTLRGLCFDTGWCYAVFWKSKRQARPVLTWEDAFYGSMADDKNASPSITIVSGLGQQVSAGLADMEDLIALSVSKMSYHVYSVGEGIIGRIAFTNKHQWVFSSNDKGTATDGASTKKANLRMQPEKYPSGWDQQFAAGIKTIAVIAVPQGVVQLGSTRVIAEDLKLIGHVKALFGTLQNVPGAFLSELVTEVQRSGVHTVYPMAVPASQLSLARTPSLPATLARTPSWPASMNISTAGVGRLPRFLTAQQQTLTHAHSMPSPSVLGFLGGVPYFQHFPCDKSVLESLSNPSFCTLQSSCTWAGSEDVRPVKMGTTSVVKPPTPISGMRVSTPPQTGVIRQFSLSSEASSIALPAATSTLFSQSVQSPYSTDSSVTGGKGVNVEEPEQLRANPPPRTGVIRHLSLNSKASPIAIPAATGAPFLQAVHSPYSVNSAGTRGKGIDVEDFEQPKANPPPRTGVIRHRSLNSKASSVAIPAVTGAPFAQAVHSPYSAHSATAGGKGFNSPCFVSSAATRSKGINVPSVGESEQSRAQSKSTFTMESPRPVSGKHMLVAAESCNVKSCIESPKFSCSTTREDFSRMVGRTWPENTRNMACGIPPVKQSGGRLFPLERRSSIEGLQPDSSRHSEISQQLDSCRTLTESGQLRRIQTLMEVQQLDWRSHTVANAQLASGPISNQLAKGGPQLDSPLPPAEISTLVDRPAIESNQLSARSSSLPSEHLGVPSIPKGVHQFDKSAFESSALGGSNLLSASNTSVFGGLPLSTSCTLNQDSHERESGSVSAKNTFPCEEITSEGSHLTVQISDLLELAQRFENADSEGHKDFTTVNVDSHQSFSSNLFDDCFESMQSLIKSPEPPAGDFGSAEYSVHNLFSSELDDFDEFFASLNKAEKGKNGLSALPETVSNTRSNCEVSGYLNIDSYDVTLKGKAKFTNIISGSHPAACHVASAANQPLPDWVANEATSPGKKMANLGKDLQVDRFVNSRIYPELSLPCSRLDGDTDLGCQEMAVLPPPASRQCETRKKGKKRRWPAEDDGTRQSQGRQKMQERIQELRAIVPDGARCGIDTLLERALGYASALQTVSQDSGDKGTPSTNLQIHGGGTEIDSNSEASTSFDASWVVDIGAQERACPVLVESLSQPGQMLVEVMCQEHAIFLKIADIIKRLGFTIVKGVMEARNNSIWARFVIEGPKEIHRVQVLWSLMHLLGENMES